MKESADKGALALFGRLSGSYLLKRMTGAICKDRNISRDKIDIKHVCTEVDFVVGSQFIRHAMDDSEPIAGLKGNILTVESSLQVRNASAKEMGDPRENPPTSGHDSHLRNRESGEPSLSMIRDRFPAMFARRNRAGRCRLSGGFSLGSSVSPALAFRRCSTNGAAPECKGGGKWEIPEETRRPAASSGTIPTCSNPESYPGRHPQFGTCSQDHQLHVGKPKSTLPVCRNAIAILLLIL
ncbi:hypothetical protein PR048_002801 [Dryococelus australis]|uniref:Uncharacterized protein n=1 Tax=Dryococelus australis TaxID=614101 RepID=A0ABQ9IL64_9NEOP|nr:hypothetical protein PR048_002801 [Dryococelus australis]